MFLIYINYFFTRFVNASAFTTKFNVFPSYRVFYHQGTYSDEKDKEMYRAWAHEVSQSLFIRALILSVAFYRTAGCTLLIPIPFTRFVNASAFTTKFNVFPSYRAFYHQGTYSDKVINMADYVFNAVASQSLLHVL